MDEQDDESRHIDPSEKRLRQAKERGDVPRLAELSSALSLSLFLSLLAALGYGLGPAPLEAIRVFWSDVISAGDAPARLFLGPVMTWVSVLMGASLLVALSGALAVAVASGNFVVAGTRIAPKLNRISPLSGAREKVSISNLLEFLKSAAKLLLFGVIAVALVTAFLREDLWILLYAPEAGFPVIARLMLRFFMACAALSLVIGLLDFLAQRRIHFNKMKMTTRDAKEEMRESEGDPYQKSRRRQLAGERARGHGLADVPKADVVIVNPTHFAVAVAWNRSEEGVPRVVAKGTDEVALRIRSLAQEAGVCVRRDAPTARSLYALCEIGDPIRREHFKAVAAAIRFADTLRSMRRS